mmetsp:Transcript_36374/g.46321  ORF Transcript_36374/g.46321 Transcript_36374/m.46321 type:complete len:195 (-) Transcript_36374:230-814(-)
MVILRVLWNIASGHASRISGNFVVGSGITAPAVWRTRAWYSDCDMNLHMNNASYLKNMELARWHMMSGNGMLGQAIKKRWTFLVASQFIRHRYSIQANQPYEIHTQVLDWDNEWVYIAQHFQDISQRTCALAVVCSTVRKGKTVINPVKFLEEAGLENIEKPASRSNIMKNYIVLDENFKSHLRRQTTQIITEN